LFNRRGRGVQGFLNTITRTHKFYSGKKGECRERNKRTAKGRKTAVFSTYHCGPIEGAPKKRDGVRIASKQKGKGGIMGKDKKNTVAPCQEFLTPTTRT